MNIKNLALAFFVLTTVCAAGVLTGCKVEGEVDPDGNAETSSVTPSLR